jgi:hypothetical protein
MLTITGLQVDRFSAIGTGYIDRHAPIHILM